MIFEPQAKLFKHGDRVKEWLETGRTTPILIEIAPTGYCNAKCPWCFFKEKLSEDYIEREVMIQALTDMGSIGVKAINWTGGGEPILHPNFDEFVLYAKQKGLKQGLFTNGYTEIPHQKLFDWIRISLTDKAFKPIIKPKEKFGICVNHIESHTKEQLIQLCKEAKDFGASYFQIRPALVGDYRKQPKLEVPIYLENYKRKNFEVYVTDYKYKEAINPKAYTECYGYHFCPSIDWNGQVGVCLYLIDDDNFVFGDLYSFTLQDIFNIFTDYMKVTDQCQNCCKNHEINKILYNIKNVEEEDFL